MEVIAVVVPLVLVVVLLLLRYVVFLRMVNSRGERFVGKTCFVEYSWIPGLRRAQIVYTGVDGRPAAGYSSWMRARRLGNVCYLTSRTLNTWYLVKGRRGARDKIVRPGMFMRCCRGTAVSPRDYVPGEHEACCLFTGIIII